MKHGEFFRIKVFETDLFDEFNHETKTGNISNAIDEELQDLNDHKILIIPIHRNDQFFIFVVDISGDEEVDVQLNYIESAIETNDDDEMSEISGIIINLIERAFTTIGVEFDKDKIAGSINPCPSLSHMIQEVEVKITECQSNIALSEYEIKHKIIDRILAIKGIE